MLNGNFSGWNLKSPYSLDSTVIDAYLSLLKLWKGFYHIPHSHSKLKNKTKPTIRNKGFFYFLRVSTYNMPFWWSLFIIRLRHQLVFCVSRDWIPNLYSIIKSFTNWTNWNPQNSLITKISHSSGTRGSFSLVIIKIWF